MSVQRTFAGLNLLALMACSGDTHTAPQNLPPLPANSATNGSADTAQSQRFTTPTRKVWTLREAKRSPSLSVVSISGEGFTHTRDSVELGEGAPFEAAHLTDLDGNDRAKIARSLQLVRTEIWRGLAFSDFGSTTRSTPFVSCASIFA